MSLIARLQGMLRRDRLDRDLDEELRRTLKCGPPTIPPPACLRKTRATKRNAALATPPS